MLTLKQFVKLCSIFCLLELGICTDNYTPPPINIRAPVVADVDLTDVIRRVKVLVQEEVQRAVGGLNVSAILGFKDNPAFFVTMQQHPFTLHGIDDVAKFDGIKVNIGGGYSSKTGYFVCPKPGVYHISAMILGNHGHVVHYQLNVNDDAYVIGYSKLGTADSSTSLQQKVETIRDLVETTVVLHNLLRQRGVMAATEVDHEDERHNFVQGAWRHGPHGEDVPQPPARGNLATVHVDARHQREHLRDNFVSAVGAVDWQARMAGVVLPAAVEERNGSEADDEDED